MAKINNYEFDYRFLSKGVVNELINLMRPYLSVTSKRCIGVCKRRLPVLSLKSRLKLENMQAVIIAAMLHNIVRSMNLEELESEISVTDTLQENNIIVRNNFPERTSEIQLLINNCFQR
ncbi:uncharacterized protein LOC114252420 [Bombyx mandarina]|uniref:Uncharacterized protein LOC114252420 n=1 Tax=Bombyx mandarina TaxID=7092 RepID=A0A6J2KK31_BOMMA|nr:uncharacterized protein LOC114252420 [Bombyx mandarina]